jgi:MFS family permease
MGFAKTWNQVLAIRILLGVFAAGYFPGCMYLLSCWYLRCEPFLYIHPISRAKTNLLVPIPSDEVQKRFSVFYGVGCVASALAGILAFGLIHMDGIQGISGWRWIFILEGVVCYGSDFYPNLIGF